jgi:hypothetical protein
MKQSLARDLLPLCPVCGHEGAFPLRSVNFCTKRFRGNVTDAAEANADDGQGLRVTETSRRQSSDSVTFHDGVGYRLGSWVCALTEVGPNVITLIKDRGG